MDSFCRDTRHKERDFSEAPVKFLCTQLPSFIDYSHVFPFVSDDLEAINFRAPGILDSYANVRQVSPKLLGELVSSPDNLKKAQNVPIFKDYIEKINPPKGKEVQSFFVHGQKKKNLTEHIEALTSNVDEQKRLFKSIHEYQVPKTMDMSQVVISVGDFLNSLTIGEHNEEEVEDEIEVEDEYEDEVNREIKLPVKPQTAFDETDHWENPVLKAFKIEAGLSTRFSSEKTIKQVLVSSCAPHMNQHLELGKNQTEIPSVQVSSIEHFPLSYIDHLPNETIESIVATSQCQDLYHGLLVKPADGRELVKTLLTVYHPDLCKVVQVSKNYEKPEKIDNSIISSLLKASSTPLQA